jgi:hypothetical protein
MNGESLFEVEAVPDPFPLRNGVPPTARTFLKGKISTFRMKALPVKVAVFCPKAALTAQEVAVLVYAHGLLEVCQPPVKNPPEGLITGSTFQLGQLVDASNRALVVVAPLFDWSVRGFHLLGKPANLNMLVVETMQQLSKMIGRKVGLSRLILSGHSRGFDFLEPLARANADPQTNQGALAKLSEVWAFDTTYICDPTAWLQWLRSKPSLRATFYYRRNTKPASKPVGTMRAGDALHAVQGHAGGRLKVIQISAETGEGHCQVPVQRLKEVLGEVRGGGSQLPLPSPALPSSPQSVSTTTAPGGRLRARIVHMAKEQLAKWSQGKKTETDPAMRATLAGYWGAVRKSSAAIEAAIDARAAWSAAFLSWVMREAGAGTAFRASSAHTAYIAAAKKHRNAGDQSKFWAYRISEARPEIGDLVAKDRKPKGQSVCAGTTYDNVERGGVAHSDIVVGIDSANGKMTVVGGNVNDSVATHLIQLTADGHLPALAHDGCKYIAILKPPQALAVVASPPAGSDVASPHVAPAPSKAPAIPAFVTPATVTPTIPPTHRPVYSGGHCPDDRCTSAYIRWMQTALNGLGFKLKVTGALDARTLGAILRFKRRVQLKTKEAYSGPMIQRALVTAGAQPPPPLTKAPCGVTPVQELIPVLNKYRGDIPLEILLGWAELESGRQLGSSTSLCERGYFQVHPGNSVDLKLNHDLIGTDKDYSVRAGIALVNQCRRAIAALKVPSGSELYWRLVKLSHWIPSGPRKLFALMRQNGVEPQDWEAIQAFVQQNDEALKIHFKGRRPSQGIRNVNSMFRKVRVWRPKLRSSISANGRIQ